MSTTRLQNKIMRGIYYAFAIRLATRPVSFGLAFLAVSLYSLSKLVFVARVMEGFMNVQVKDLVPHTVGVLSNADVLTLIVFAVCLGSVFYVGFNLITLGFHRTPRMQMA